MYIILPFINRDDRMIDILCSFCKKKFSSKWAPSWNRPSPKYCSRACMASGFFKIVSNTCGSCGKEFETRPCEVRKYCCLKCFKRPISYPNRKKTPSFWDTATEEHKIIRYKEMFENKVIKKEGCWGWKGVPGKSGYGHIGSYRNLITAHRLSWIIHNEPIPEGFWVLHKCHNPICSNPNHLYLGTAKDNTQDMFEAGRGNRSRQNSKNSKLTLEQAKEIKILLATTKLSQYEIAKKFNVGRGTVQDIKRNKSWRNA